MKKKKTSPGKLYKDQLEKLKRAPNYRDIKPQIIYVGGKPTKEDYMTAYKKNRSLWKMARGIGKGQSRINQMENIKVTVKDKRILKRLGYDNIDDIKNHYEALCLIKDLKDNNTD